MSRQTQTASSADLSKPSLWDGETCQPTPTEHLFTGKERDTESGNDYFDARYYSSAMGRFMSPDWSAKVEPVPYAKLDDPQSLNLYAYVLNNPLSGVDADGHTCGENGEQACATTQAQAQQQGHLQKAVQNLKAALNETAAKVTIGLEVGEKVAVGSLKLRAEVAEKDNLTFSNGKIAVSNSMEGGVSGGTSKQFGLAG